jgi:GNAT superfamily N-acetyltransferase
MTNSVSIRRAVDEDDVQAVAKLWIMSARWIASRGLDQWQYPVRVESILSDLQDRILWVVQDGDRPVGTITVDNVAEPQYWFPSDDPADALYVHRMVTDESVKGRRLGVALLDWVARSATAQNLSWVRLDAWRTNILLHKYYQSVGFDLVRVVVDPSGSGACFQRNSSVQLGEGPDIVELTPDSSGA